MSSPNIVLSWWQLTLMAVVPVASLAGWLVAIFIAAREPRVRNAAAPSAGLAPGQAAVGQAAVGQDEPARPDRPLAA